MGYGRTLQQYAQTPKGAFDLRDSLKAAGCISLTALLAFVVLHVLY